MHSGSSLPNEQVVRVQRLKESKKIPCRQEVENLVATRLVALDALLGRRLTGRLVPEGSGYGLWVMGYGFGLWVMGRQLTGRLVPYGLRVHVLRVQVLRVQVLRVHVLRVQGLRVHVLRVQVLRVPVLRGRLAPGAEDPKPRRQGHAHDADDRHYEDRDREHDEEEYGPLSK